MQLARRLFDLIFVLFIFYVLLKMFNNRNGPSALYPHDKGDSRKINSKALAMVLGTSCIVVLFASIYVEICGRTKVLGIVKDCKKSMANWLEMTSSRCELVHVEMPFFHFNKAINC